MQFVFLLVFLSFSCCFAQINPMSYFNKAKCEEALPDFAALAVIESQRCPNPLTYEHKEQICDSRYRIIHVLHVASNALKKEYIEAKGKFVYPYYQHRPMLIFGKRKNGAIQIEGYEETREYFDCFDSYEYAIERQDMEFSPMLSYLSRIYALHSIGTPYYDIRNLDSVNRVFYDEYIVPYFKQRTEIAEKDFSKLWQRLTQNRTPIIASKIKNDFAALGVIESARPVSGSKQANLYELRVTMETIFKNDAQIKPSITILIDGSLLPSGWGCMPIKFFKKKPFYLLGDLKDSSLVIEQLASTHDAFVFGDTLYDISMGFPFKELLAYFLPSNMSLEEFEFGQSWEHLLNKSIKIDDLRKGIFPEIMQNKFYNPEIALLPSVPNCLKKDIMKVAIRWEEFFGEDFYKRWLPLIKTPYNMFVESQFTPPYHLNKFRCQRRYPPKHIYEPPEKEDSPCVCRGRSLIMGEGTWGRKW